MEDDLNFNFLLLTQLERRPQKKLADDLKKNEKWKANSKKINQNQPN